MKKVKPFEPRLRLSYIGTSGSVEVSAISPKAAARKWPKEFQELLAEMNRAGAVL